ncbi:MAG: hypothetical protein LBS65_06960, partial [Desulfovibrio sp.]|nr:hypothetical protein [Desulfovibrio sp.]
MGLQAGVSNSKGSSDEEDASISVFGRREVKPGEYGNGVAALHDVMHTPFHCFQHIRAAFIMPGN